MTHGSLSQCKEVKHWACGCCSGSVELAGSASWDTGEYSDQPLHSDSKHWGCCWVHHSSPEHGWALLGVVPDCQTTARGAASSGCHTVVGFEDTAGSGFTGVLATIPLIGWPLVSLLKTLLRISTWAGVASRSLPLELPLLGVHLLALIVDYNSTIHKFLKGGVDIGHQLQLETIIQSV
jgi:hypothetical protein